jgi:ribosome-binding factor A
VEGAIREVLSNTVPSLKDPRIGFVTVTGVRATKDLSEAKVYVSVLGGEPEQERTLVGLRAAQGVLQGAVARALGLRKTPVLSFEYDPAIEMGIRLTKMIDELAPSEPDAEQ